MSTISNGSYSGGEVKKLFIGAGCNRIVNNVSWGACDFVSFGAQNAVARFCPKTAQILTTLLGHKASVNCTHWIPSNKFAFIPAKHLEQHYLLSGDADGAIILWELSLADRKWKQVLQLLHSHKKGVTCITGIVISKTEAIFASTSSNGTVYVWELILPSPGGECKLSCLDTLLVGSKPRVALSVAELPGNNSYFYPWQNEASSSNEESWHEITRPQIHGHDINCVAIIQGQGNHRFISGADEKVSRVFEAPLSFLKTLNHTTCQKSSSPEDLQVDVQILGASLSALHLSQKPIYVYSMHETPGRNGNDGLDTHESIPDAVPVVFMEAPIEDQLAYNTLWPESHKLYGHGNELFSLCCNHGGKLVASSCKAQSVTVAEIWPWQVGSWKAVGRLQSHSLTVTQMEFSHDDNMLLAVSRDWQFSIFRIKRMGTEEIDYELLARQETH